MNKTQKKTNVILLAMITILLCIATVAAGTFALFTDSVVVKNHLVAGSLDAQLVRTHLVYTKFENEELVPVTVEDDLALDGEHDVDENVFGLNKLDTNNNYIVPGSFFEATLQIKNNGNIAFDYDVEIDILEGRATELAKQLKVTVTDHEGHIVSKSVSEMPADGVLVVDGGERLKSTDGAVEFKVRVEFENLDDEENNKVNNDDIANKSVKFDLVVKAVQSPIKND